MKKLYQPFTDTINDTYRDITKTITESSFKNNEALNNLNNFLEILNERGVLTYYSLSPLSKKNNHKDATQLKLVKDSISNRVNDLLIHNTIPNLLYNNLWTFRDTINKLNYKEIFWKW